MEDNAYARKNEQEQLLMQSILDDNKTIEAIMEGRESEIERENREVKTGLLKKIAEDTTELKSTIVGLIKNETETKSSIDAINTGMIDLAQKFKDANANGVEVPPNEAKAALSNILKYVDNLTISVSHMEPSAKTTVRDNHMTLTQQLVDLLKVIPMKHEPEALAIAEALLSLDIAIKNNANTFKPATIEMQINRVRDAILFLEQDTNVKDADAHDFYNELKRAENQLAAGQKLASEEYTHIIRQLGIVQDRLKWLNFLRDTLVVN